MPALVELCRRAASSHLFQSTAVYSVSRILNAAIPFLIMPVLTRYMTPADYGIVAMFGVIQGIANPFVGLSLHGAVSVKYFDKKDPDLSRYIGNCVLIILANACIAFLILQLLAKPVHSLTQFPGSWLWAVVFGSACQAIIFIVMILWQVEHKALIFGVFQNLQTAMNIGLSIVFVVLLHMNWRGRIGAHVITVFFFALIGGLFLVKSKKIDMEPKGDHIRHALRFGVPLIPHAIGGFLISQSDRVFIAKMVSLADAGIYSVAFQLALAIEMLAASFNQAYSPWLFNQLSKDDRNIKKMVVKLTYSYFAGILVIALIFSAVAPWFLSFFVGKDFVGAQRYIFWLSLGFSFSGMYYMVTNYIFFANKTAYLAAVTFGVALLNIVLNYALITLNGAVGAAQASALALFASFVLTWIVSARVYKMPWNPWAQ
ncbi:MAG: oligosaccharide flippase family protein [Elusimicrobia bacterium]|nr:oligosaccharide flippase family protein [Elusimicrobiota bacterium]